MGCNKKYYGVEPDMLTYEFIGTCNYWKVFMERKKTKYPTKIKIISMVSRKKANYHITYSWNLMRIVRSSDWRRFQDSYPVAAKEVEDLLKKYHELILDMQGEKYGRKDL